MHYRFHRLLAATEVQEGEIDVRGLLRKAQRQLDEIGAIVGYWDFPVSTLVPCCATVTACPANNSRSSASTRSSTWSTWSTCKRRADRAT